MCPTSTCGNPIPGSLKFQPLMGRRFRYCLLPIQRHRWGLPFWWRSKKWTRRESPNKLLTKTEISTSLPLSSTATYPAWAKVFEVHKQISDTLGGESWCIVRHKILVLTTNGSAGCSSQSYPCQRAVLYEKKIGWITSWNLSMQDCPRCPGCNHYEFLHESQAFLVCFAAQRLESLQ